MLCIDPNAPKGPRSAWHFFTSSRKQALGEQPHGTAFKIMSHLSGEYKALLEEERSVFDEMAKNGALNEGAQHCTRPCVAFCSLYFGQFVYCVGIGYLLLECANDYNEISLLFIVFTYSLYFPF